MTLTKPPTHASAPRFLYRLGMALAASLFLLVILSPLADNGAGRPEGAARVLALFARDLVLRQTALASAVGLAVTASVFFRAPAAARRPAPPAPEPRRPPTRNVGA